MILLAMSLTLATMVAIAIVRRAPQPGCSFALRELILWSGEGDQLDTWTTIDGLTQAGLDVFDGLAWARHGRRAWLAGALERRVRETDMAHTGAKLLRAIDVATRDRRIAKLVTSEAMRGLSGLRYDRFDAFDGELVPYTDDLDPNQIAAWMAA